MEKYYGNYLGIVVNSNDPENRNRLQVWIPNLTNTLYSKWNDDLTNKLLDYNGYVKDDDVYRRLINTLPWAECASPLIGGGTAINVNPMVNNQSNATSLGTPVQPNDPDDPTGIDFETPVAELPSEDPTVVEVPLPEEGKDTLDDSPFSVPTSHNPEGDNEAIEKPNVSTTSSSWQESTPEAKSVLNNLRIKDLYGGRTITGSDLNLEQNLDSLQNTNLEAFAGGYNDVETIYFAGLIQKNYDNSVDRVTGVNDVYHAVNRPTSKHTNGNKFDITFKNGVSLSQGGMMVRNTAAQYGLAEGVDYKVIDSYHGTGAHVDIELTDSGRDILAKHRTGISTKTIASIASQQINNQTSGNSNPIISNPLDSTLAANGSPSPVGAAKGVISSPSLAARVWVFFYGGDIQKPVYFATSITASEYGQSFQS